MLNEAKQGTRFQRNKKIKIIKMTMKIISVSDSLGWTKEKLLVSHKLNHSEQYNFNNCNVTLWSEWKIHCPFCFAKIYNSKVVFRGAVQLWWQNLYSSYGLSLLTSFILPYLHSYHTWSLQKIKISQTKQFYNSNNALLKGCGGLSVDLDKFFYYNINWLNLINFPTYLVKFKK